MFLSRDNLESYIDGGNNEMDELNSKDIQRTENTMESKYVCLTCGRSLEHATSICPCGGRATRRPRKEQDLLEEENKIRTMYWKHRRYTLLGIISAVVLLLLGMMFLSNYYIIWVILTALGLTLFIVSLASTLFTNCCPFCGKFLYRTSFGEILCPYCGKRLKQTQVLPPEKENFDRDDLLKDAFFKDDSNL